MSIIRDHVLAGGSMSLAHKAAAAAVFELAQAGYLTIRLPASRIEAVRLTRTAKPSDSILPEQQILLRVIFETDNRADRHAYLAASSHIAVASSLAAYARALLVRDGSIRKIRPRLVYRCVSIFFYTTLAVGSAVTVIIFRQIEALFLALTFSGIAWAFFAGFTLNLKHARVFRLPKSKKRYKMLDELRANSHYNLYRASVTVAADQLPYELLWLRYGKPRSVAAGLYDQKPAWCDNDAWFATRKQITRSFVTAMETMARSLGGQESIAQHIYAQSAEYPAPDREQLAEKKLEILTEMDDSLRETYEMAADMDDWGGGDGDGSGGDGGDGSGGDGGGDGGGGDD